MGRSHEEFVKYPRTPHLFGSKGTDDDKHLGEAESLPFFLSGRLYDDGVIDPRDTRTVLAMALSAVHTAPITGVGTGGPGHAAGADAGAGFGVWRM